MYRENIDFSFLGWNRTGLACQKTVGKILKMFGNLLNTWKFWKISWSSRKFLEFGKKLWKFPKNLRCRCRCRCRCRWQSFSSRNWLKQWHRIRTPASDRLWTFVLVTISILNLSCRAFSHFSSHFWNFLVFFRSIFDFFVRVFQTLHLPIRYFINFGPQL